MDVMLAAAKHFENLSISIAFGALFQQSGNKFRKMHPQAPPKFVWGGECTPPTGGSMSADLKSWLTWCFNRRQGPPLKNLGYVPGPCYPSHIWDIISVFCWLFKRDKHVLDSLSLLMQNVNANQDLWNDPTLRRMTRLPCRMTQPPNPYNSFGNAGQSLTLTQIRCAVESGRWNSQILERSVDGKGCGLWGKEGEVDIRRGMGSGVGTL